MELDHESNYRVFPIVLYQVVITGFSSQYLYCLIKWLLQGFPHSICTVSSSGYYRVFLTVFVLSHQVVITGFSSQYLYCLIKWLLQGFPHSICTVSSSGYYRVFLTVFVLSHQVVITGFSSQYLYCLIKWLVMVINTLSGPSI